MSAVNKFVLDGQTIDVEDSTARAEASSAMSIVQTVQNEVNEIKELSRLTVSYDSKTSTITFVSNTHNQGE